MNDKRCSACTASSSAKRAFRFAVPEDVIVHKLVAGRPRDLEDVKGILAKGPDLDESSLPRWLSDVAVMLDEPLVQHFEDLRAQL